MMSEDEFIWAAREFLCERLGSKGEHVDGDTELLDSGLLDSLMILEFFFFLENVRGDALQSDASSISAMATLRSAYQLVSTHER